MRIRPLLLGPALAGAALLAPLASAAAQSPDAVIDRAVAAYASVRSVHATFDQTVNNPLTGTTVSASGDMWLQRSSGKFSVKFTNPPTDRVVGDGRAIWVYLPSTNPGQVIKVPQSAGMPGPDVVNDLLESPKTKFSLADAGTATVAGRATHAVALTPKGERAFSKATVWVDDADGTVRQFELTEQTGLVRRVRMTSIEKNVAIPSATFTFTPPSGVHVMDGTQLGQ